MLSKSVFVLLAFCALATAASQKPSLFLEHTISNMLMKSMEAFTNDVPNSPECFSIFKDKSEKLKTEYEDGHLFCIDDAEGERQKVQNELAADRAQMTATSDNICKQYSNCNADSNTMGFFTCYANSGDQAAKTSNSIAFNASEALEKIKQRLFVIDSNETVCTEECNYFYETNMVKAQEELDACNKGKVQQ